MDIFKEILQTRPFLSIREVDGYELRLKNGEKKRELEQKEVQQSILELGFDSNVQYKENGQPYLEKHPDLFLSISHSKGWIAVYIDKHPVGIDIELENPRILEGTSYFVNKREQVFSKNLNTLHLIWGAKEAFYKLKEGQIDDLKNEVTLISHDLKTLQIEFQQQSFCLEYIQENGITIVLT